MARRRDPSPKPTDAAIIAAVLVLVQGGDDAAALARIIREGMPRDDAGLVLAEARKRLQVAADYHRGEELGKAIKRLNKLIRLNLRKEEGDHSVALRAQIELDKLLRLHEVNAGATGGAEEESQADRLDELSRVRDHLAPLFGAMPDDYPVSELARMAAEKVRTADGGDDTQT